MLLPPMEGHFGKGWRIGFVHDNISSLPYLGPEGSKSLFYCSTKFQFLLVDHECNVYVWLGLILVDQWAKKVWFNLQELREKREEKRCSQVSRWKQPESFTSLIPTGKTHKQLIHHLNAKNGSCALGQNNCVCNLHHMHHRTVHVKQQAVI